MLDRPGRVGPLTVDALTAFVQEDGGIAAPRVQLGRVVGDEREGALYQGPVPILLRASVCWLPLLASCCTLRYAPQVRCP